MKKDSPSTNGRNGKLHGTTGFAGIRNAGVLSSIDVKANGTRLRRLQYVLRRLVSVGAGHLPARKEWDVKMTIARHMYEDAEQATSLLDRILELRVTDNQAQKAPDALLTLFMDEVLHAQSDTEYLLAIYEVLRPALHEAVIRHMSETQALVDHPTVRCLGFLKMEMEVQIIQGQRLLAEFATRESRERASEFIRHIRQMLANIGGIDGTSAADAQAVRRWRSNQPYILPVKSARPDDFGPSLHYRLPGCLDASLSDEENALREMMKIRQEEMTAAEMIAGVIYETSNMPWGFYRTLARHTWDEARHAAFGQAALEQHGIEWRSCPHYTAEYEKFREESPAKAYAFLSLGVETSVMAKNGKQHELHLCRNIFKDELMALFQDYDWADEVQHARFGREWGTAFFNDDYEYSRNFGEQAWMELLKYRASLEPNRDEYHTMFYLEKFGKQPVMQHTELALAVADE